MEQPSDTQQKNEEVKPEPKEEVKPQVGTTVPPAAATPTTQSPALPPVIPKISISLYSVSLKEAVIKAESDVKTKVWCTPLLSFQTLHKDTVMKSQSGVEVEKPTVILIPGLYANQFYNVYCFAKEGEPVKLSFNTVLRSMIDIWIINSLFQIG